MQSMLVVRALACGNLSSPAITQEHPVKVCAHLLLPLLCTSLACAGKCVSGTHFPLLMLLLCLAWLGCAEARA